MSSSKADMTQIRKYLDGELDANAMHRLEKASHDDPFLMDALEGYSSAANNQEKNLTDLNSRLADRTLKKTAKVISLRFIAIAASLIIALGIGGLWLMSRHTQPRQDIVALNQPPTLRAVSADTNNRKDSVKSVTYAKTRSTIKQYEPVSKTNLVRQGNAQITVNEQIAATLIPNKAPDVPGKVSQPITVQPGSGYNAYKQVREDTTIFKNGLVNKKQDSLYFNKPLIAKVRGVQMTPSQGFNSNMKKAKMVNGVIIDDNSKTETGLITTTPVKPDQYNPGSAVASEDVVAGYAAAHKNVGRSTSTRNQETKQSADADVSAVVTGQSAGIPVAKSNPVYTPPKAGGRLVKGTVTDKQDGQPLPGAVVKIRGATAGVVTDARGRFTLRDVDDKATLTISFIGYNSRVINIGSADSLRVSLSANSNSLAEVVITNNSAPTMRSIGARPVNGWAAFNKYLKTNAVSPDGKTGTVKLSFLVDADGDIIDIKIIKGISNAADQQAVKLLNNGPDWNGNSNGKPEKVTLKIKF